MADIYALLRETAAPLYALKKGAGWRITDRAPDIGPRGRKLGVIVLGEGALGLSAIIPARTEKEARRAAPFAIEDEIAEPAETVHIALGPKPENPSDARTLCVTSSAQIEAWSDTLEAQGWQDASLIAAHSLLPQGNHLFDAAPMVLGRLAGRTFALEQDIGTDVFLGLLDGVEDVSIHGERLATALQKLAQGQGANTDEALLAQFATWASETPPINLRQGAYQPKRRIELGGLGQWRRVGVLAAAAIIGWFGVTLYETNRTAARTAALEQRTAEFVQAGWPEAGGNVDTVLAEIRQAPRGPEASVPSALTAMAALYAALETVPGSQLRSVRYDRTRAQITSAIAFDGFGGSDALVRALADNGFTARAGDARQIGGKVVAEISMGAAS
ncbi:MAG: GspL family type II secretion system protein XcpY [Henriciella sp.]